MTAPADAGTPLMFTRTDLEAARDADILDAPAFSRLAAFLETRTESGEGASMLPPVRFDLSHLLWYAGALIILGAMGLFSTLAFAQMGGAALTTTALAYGAAFVVAGHHLWRSRGLVTPGGLLVACAVGMVPLAIFGIQEASGVWGETGRPGNPRDYYIWIKGGWVPMEIGTLVAALIALRFYPFPFIVAVAALALWFLTMDIAEFVARNTGWFDYSWRLRSKVTMWFGLAIIPVAWFVDLKRRSGDFAFWLHLAGIAAFWGGLTSQSSDSELSKFFYFLLNVGLIFLAVLLVRRVYAVFGAIGVTLYLGHLAGTVFKDSLLFPFALSLIGVAIIGLGILYFRKRDAIQQAVDDALPPALKALRPAHARS